MTTTFTAHQINDAAREATDMISAEGFGADVDLAYDVASRVEDRLFRGITPRRRSYTRDQAMTLVNNAANWVTGKQHAERFRIEYSDTIRDRSLVDLMVNLTGSLLDDPDVSLDAAIEAGWQSDDEDVPTVEMVRGWLA